MILRVDFITVIALALAVAISGLISLRLARLGWWPRLWRTCDLSAVQASHTTEAPRLGGIAILATFLITVLINGMRDHEAVLLGSGIIVFLAGLREDLWGNVSARRRLFASLVSAALATLLSGAMITRLDIKPLDLVLGTLPLVAVVLTILLSAAYTHAFNLIDGVNGLSSLVGISTALGLAWTAELHGQTAISLTALLMAAAILGFSIVNWPHGRLFLGDGGAYFIGHSLFWIAVVLAANAPLLNIPAIMLMMFWPIAEMMTTVVRRSVRRLPLGRPDRLHIHHVILRGIEIVSGSCRIRPVANALTSVIVLPAVVMPPLLGATFTKNQGPALVTLIVCLVLYAVSYVFLIAFMARPKARRMWRHLGSNSSRDAPTFVQRRTATTWRGRRRDFS